MLALIVLCLGFGLAEPGFATVENLWTIADRSAIPLILAVGTTFIILQGSIDLSIEGVMAASSLTFAMCVLNSRTGLDLGVFGLVLATFAGAGLGLLSGLVITCLRVPSFMVTLGVWSASTGIAMLLSGDQPPLIKDPMLRALGLGAKPCGSEPFSGRANRCAARICAAELHAVWTVQHGDRRRRGSWLVSWVFL